MHQNTRDPTRQVIRVLRGWPIVVSGWLIRVTDESGQEGSLGLGREISVGTLGDLACNRQLCFQ